MVSIDRRHALGLGFSFMAAAGSGLLIPNHSRAQSSELESETEPVQPEQSPTEQPQQQTPELSPPKASPAFSGFEGRENSEAELSSTEPRKLFIAPGVGDNYDDSWIEKRASMLRENKYNFEKMARAAYNYRLTTSACLTTFHKQVLASAESELYLLGFSAGGGFLQMYMDALGRGLYTLPDSKSIKEVILLNSRNMYNFKVLDCPTNLRGFYQLLKDPYYALKSGAKFKVAYGKDEEPNFSNNGLAQTLGVMPMEFVNTGHDGIVSDELKLLKVLS